MNNVEKDIVEQLSKVEGLFWDIQTYCDPDFTSCGGINYGVALANTNDLIREAAKLQELLARGTIKQAIAQMDEKRGAYQAELDELDEQIEKHQEQEHGTHGV
jgi:hypothetical protein